MVVWIYEQHLYRRSIKSDKAISFAAFIQLDPQLNRMKGVITNVMVKLNIFFCQKCVSCE
ncbi:hypothetical protein ABD86_01815 [Paenibacillus alvei]|nr:hypothetical protein [Paenibacillus alvei]MBG9742725.1 hypothetical protein [Paenibacillus alvei]